MLVKIEARILIFPGTDFHFPSMSVPLGTFLGSVRDLTRGQPRMHFFNHYHVLFLMNNLDSSSKSNTNSTVDKFLALFWRRKLLESGRTRQTISLAKQHEGPAMISKVERSCTPVLTGREHGP